MAHICHGKKTDLFGASFGTRLLQTGASRKKPLIGNVSPLWAKQQSLPLLTLYFISTGNIDQQEIRAEIWNYAGFVWPFYTLIEFSRHLMSIIQI
jgi:hypothetical protein